MGMLERIPPSDSQAEKEPPYQRSVIDLVFARQIKCIHEKEQSKHQDASGRMEQSTRNLR